MTRAKTSAIPLALRGSAVDLLDRRDQGVADVLILHIRAVLGLDAGILQGLGDGSAVDVTVLDMDRGQKPDDVGGRLSRPLHLLGQIGGGLDDLGHLLVGLLGVGLVAHD